MLNFVRFYVCKNVVNFTEDVIIDSSIIVKMYNYLYIHFVILLFLFCPSVGQCFLFIYSIWHCSFGCDGLYTIYIYYFR